MVDPSHVELGDVVYYFRHKDTGEYFTSQEEVVWDIDIRNALMDMSTKSLFGELEIHELLQLHSNVHLINLYRGEIGIATSHELLEWDLEYMLSVAAAEILVSELGMYHVIIDRDDFSYSSRYTHLLLFTKRIVNYPTLSPTSEAKITQYSILSTKFEDLEQSLYDTPESPAMYLNIDGIYTTGIETAIPVLRNAHSQSWPDNQKILWWREDSPTKYDLDYL